MTIVVAYADTPPGHVAVDAAVAESAREQETVILVPAVRGESVPEVAEVGARWPAIADRVEVERGDLGDPSDTVVQVAQRRDARLVVLGLRARTRSASWFSVAPRSGCCWTPRVRSWR
jgi:nucleotide-binding universal stress UspA family protein